jgi:hypothetical protein
MDNDDRIERRVDGYYHRGHRIKSKSVYDKDNRLVSVERLNHDKGIFETVIHLNYGYQPFATYHTRLDYEDGTNSDTETAKDETR